MQTAATSPGGFVAWIETYGQIIGFFVQMIYYIVIAAAAVWAAKTFAGYVKYMTSADVDSDAAPAASTTPIDEFVE